MGAGTGTGILLYLHTTIETQNVSCECFNVVAGAEGGTRVGAAKGESSEQIQRKGRRQRQ